MVVSCCSGLTVQIVTGDAADACTMALELRVIASYAAIRTHMAVHLADGRVVCGGIDLGHVDCLVLLKSEGCGRTDKKDCC